MAGPGQHIIVKIGGEVLGSLTSSIRQTQAQVSSLGKNVTRTLTDAAAAGRKSFMGVVSNPAYQAAAVAAAGIGFGLVKATQVAADFEQQMSTVAAKMGDANDAQLKQLSDMAKHLGATTKFTAGQTAAAMDFLAMAGYKTNDILAATPGVLNLAAVGNMDLAEAADIASNILGGMGMKVGETTRLIDILAKTATSGNTSVAQLGEAFKTVGPVARQAGASAEQVGASLAVLGDRGIQGAEAGTALRNVFLRMAAPPTEAAKAFDRLGVSTKDSAGNMRPFEAILGDMDKAMKRLNLGSAEQMELQSAIFGVRATTTGTILQEAAANGELAERIKKVTESQGAADKMAKTMGDNLAGALTRLGSAFEGFQLALAGPNSKVLQGFVDGLANAIGIVTQLLNKFPALGATIMALGAAFVAVIAALPFIAAGISVFSTLGTAIAAAGGAGAVLAGAFAVITGPIGLTIAAIVGVVAALVWAYNSFEWFRLGINNIFGGISQIFGSWLQYMRGIFEVIWGLLSGNQDLIKTGMDNLVGGLKGMFGGLTAFIYGVFQALGGLVLGILKGIGQAIVFVLMIPVNIIRGLGTMIAYAFQGIADAIGGALQGVGQMLTDTFGSIPNAILTALFPLPALAVGIFNQFGPAITGPIDGAVSAAKGLFDGFVAFLMSIPSRVAGMGAAIVQTIIDGIKAKVGALIDTVKGALSKVRDLLPFSDAKAGPLSTLTKSGASILTTLAGGVQSVGDGGLSAAVSSGLQDVLSGLPGFAQQALQGAANFLAPGPMAGGLTPVPVGATAGGGQQTITANFTINAPGGDGDAIAEKVKEIFADLLADAQAGQRAYLND